MEWNITSLSSMHLNGNVYYLSPNQHFTALFIYTLSISRPCNIPTKLDVLKLTAERQSR